MLYRNDLCYLDFWFHGRARIILIFDRSNCEFDARKINEPCCFPPFLLPIVPPLFTVSCFFSPAPKIEFLLCTLPTVLRELFTNFFVRSNQETGV